MSNDHVHPIFQPILNAIAPDTREQCACGKLYDPVDANGEDRDCCDSCLQNEAEAAYERSQEEPCYRGSEWAAAQAAEADWIRRNLK